MTTEVQPKYLDLIVRQGESVESFFHVSMNECDLCASLQLCVSDAARYRCADWHACQQRQRENREPDSVKLTDADVRGLLERMEVQQADMERLKRIEAAAIRFVQASEAFDANCGPQTVLWDDFNSAEKALIVSVKGGK